jgi:hypothetical protein
VFSLEEIMVKNPGTINVFLDLKTAYDRVNRNILWSRLHHKFGISWNIIKRLMALFDHNESLLVINGTRSEPIHNLRGLLQGSSLSPILFSFFIDELIREIDGPNMPKISTYGLKSNCLFFADDANLHASCTANLGILLLVSEKWALRVGMQFETTKSVIVSSTVQPGELKMYGYNLPVVKDAPYLGITFNEQGIDWASNTRKFTSKARGTVISFSQLGFNGTGWPTTSSIMVYKSFIRPQLEYGMGLRILPSNELKIVQRVQNLALRTMTSQFSKTSSNALMKLYHVEPMKFRNEKLNVKFTVGMNNAYTQGSIPAVKIWHQGLQGNQPKDSLIARAIKNPLWAGAQKINHLITPLVRGAVTESPKLAAYTTGEFAKLQHKSYCDLDHGLQNVAAHLQVEPGEPYRHCLRPGVLSCRLQRVSIIHWIVGIIARHQICKNCDRQVELSRRHAVVCSGALGFLMINYPDDFDVEGEIDELTQVMNKHRLNPPKDSFYVDMQECVSMIAVKCAGLVQEKNGYWRPPDIILNEEELEAAEDEQVRMNNAPRELPESRKRRREMDKGAQRPLGRPRLARGGARGIG